MIGLNVTNLAATATLSGGSWLAAAPVTNLATRDAADTARSTNANNSSTRIIVDHGAAVTRRVMDLREHNISSGATIRWSVGTSSGGNEVATTGTINAWQFTPRAFDGRDHGLIFVLPADATGRYDYIEIFDSSNADGYVEIAQLGNRGPHRIHRRARGRARKIELADDLAAHDHGANGVGGVVQRKQVAGGEADRKSVV